MTVGELRVLLADFAHDLRVEWADPNFEGPLGQEYESPQKGDFSHAPGCLLVRIPAVSPLGD